MRILNTLPFRGAGDSLRTLIFMYFEPPTFCPPVKTFHSALTTLPAVLAENSGAYWHWAVAIPHS